MRLHADARMRPARPFAGVLSSAARGGAATVAPAAASVAAIALLAASCAPRRAPAPPPPPAGYVARVDAMDFADSVFASTGMRILAGRRIAVDPGHGGYFRGSLGAGGLTEAQVNLGVARELRDLLEAQGAVVFLTRETDRDFLAPADSSLRADLDERVRLANAFGPELFVSVHHNADAGGRHDVNETQTYWKMGDEGPSFEAAQDVHRALVRNLGIGANRLLPGNYAVLRGSTAPAILTESSYLTYPPTEAKLREPRAWRLEAEALYLGIERWFARERPTVEWLQAPGAGAVADAGPLLALRVRGAFDHAELRLNGEPQPVEREGGLVRWRPAVPLVPGPYEALLVARLSGAGSGRSTPVRFLVEPAPRQVLLDAPLQPDGWHAAHDAALGLRARVTDAFGRAAPAAASLRVRVLGAARLAPRETLVVTRAGEAWAYLAAAPGAVPAGPLRVVAELLDASGAARDADTLALRVEPGERADARVVFLVNAATGGALDDTLAARGPAWRNPHGFARLERHAAEPAVQPLPGWRRDAGALAALQNLDDLPWVARFTPLFGGALHGRRIALDPAGNGDVPGVPGADPAGSSASGLRAAHVNLEVARALAGMLRAAGADVLLVRDSAAPVLDAERVRRSEAFRAERYLRIGHGPHAPRLGHYYASAGGRRWAERTADALVVLGLPAVAPGEDAHWTLQQTSCPALHASLARLDEPASEAALLEPGAVQREAYALLVGLAREWAPAAASWPADSLQIARAGGGPPGAGVAVTIGDALVLRADREGRVRFLRSEPGALVVTAEDRFGLRTRAVLLDAQRGAVLHSPR